MEKKDLPDNVVLIGNKDFISYMRCIEFMMIRQKKKNVILKARGKNINKAVDLAEASKNKFLKELNISIGNIKTYTSTYKDEKDVERFVSCIDIEINQN